VGTVVDDDPDVRRVLVDWLDALGHAVSEAADGETALNLLNEQFDVVILDFAMPGMNAAEVAREIWQRHPRQRIVFVSGFSDTVAIEAVAGRDALLLRKPF
jgi:CheY-like chemotaxis protein